MSTNIRISAKNLTLHLPAAMLQEIIPGDLSAITATTVGIPAIGQPWPEQGGVYAGMMPAEDGHPAYHLIVATEPNASREELEWGNRGTSIEGLSSWDGKANTSLLSERGNHPAAQFCHGLKLHGHEDWYLIARREGSLCAATVPQLFEDGYHWTSTQYSASTAFVQDFSDGYQLIGTKTRKWRARAVRRVIA